MEPTRNLLILHTAGGEEISDWETIRDIVGRDAPDIEVRIGANDAGDPALEAWQASRPSLVFTPTYLRGYSPRGGTVYAGMRLPKLDQAQTMTRAGVPTPRTLVLIPGLLLKPGIWGEYVIVKPTRSGHGRGVRLAFTEEVGKQFTKITSLGPERWQMLVQQFVDHADEKGRPTDYRVLMMFGKPLYAHKRRWAKRRRPLAELARELSNEIASNAEYQTGNRHRELVFEEDVLDLAARTCAAFPHIPVLGIDIIRERGTGKLYVLEINCGGTNWHFSSDVGKRQFDEKLRKASYTQFNALETAAALLIERTRAEAS